MTDRAIVAEIMRRLESRQKENDILKQDIKDMRENNSMILLRQENMELKKENDRLKERIRGLMMNYERYVS